MKRWTSRVCFVAPACMVMAVGVFVGVSGADASSGVPVTTNIELAPPRPIPAAQPGALPPPSIVPIDVPAVISDASKATGSGGSLSQTISVVVRRADTPGCPPEALNRNPNCRPVQ